MREITDAEFNALAEFLSDHLGDIADDARQAVYDELKARGAPAADVEAARLELDNSVDAMVKERIEELLGQKRTLH